MPELPLSYDRTIELLREVIAEFGEDHVAPKFPSVAYPDLRECDSCRYVRDGGCSCLVAHVLHRAGVPIAELEAIEGLKADEPHAAPQLLDWAAPDALLLLGCVQTEQDSGRPWGVALSNAIELLSDGADL
jgi:hypothetical protein